MNLSICIRWLNIMETLIGFGVCKTIANGTARSHNKFRNRCFCFGKLQTTAAIAIVATFVTKKKKKKKKKNDKKKERPCCRYRKYDCTSTCKKVQMFWLVLKQGNASVLPRQATKRNGNGFAKTFQIYFRNLVVSRCENRKFHVAASWFK